MICPICQKRAAAEVYRPFCSRRCADIDLGKWLTGSYAIPSDEPLENGPGSLDRDTGEAPEKPH